MARRRAAQNRLPIPPGWSSKGEIIRVDPITGKPVLTPVAVAGGTLVMPTKKAQDTAPGDEIVARGTEDVALKLGGAPTRDALLDPREGDYIPDNEAKGYHVGEVRQPAEPVLTAAGDVRFESLPEAPGPSKFEGNSAAEQKARSNAREAANPDLYGGVAHVAPSVRASDVTGVGSRERVEAQGFTVTDDPKD
jgi:hypothetical protein